MSQQILILAQVDDATGEVLQDVSERLRASGARNLQILASLGKKGRPGHVLLIDVDASREQDIALVLGVELGLWGYRVLESRHRHFDIDKQQCSITLQVGGVSLSATIGFKTISSAGRQLGLKVEHDDLARLRDGLAERGHRIALPQLRARIEQSLRSRAQEPPLRIELDGGAVS